MCERCVMDSQAHREGQRYGWPHGEVGLSGAAKDGVPMRVSAS